MTRPGELLKQRPWIRRRASGRFVTLHDAVAEELAQRIIPLHDQSGQWRGDLWRRVIAIYDDLTGEPEEALDEKLAAVDETLRQLGPEVSAQAREGAPLPT